MESKVYNNIDNETFLHLKSKLASLGVQLQGTKGQVSGFQGITLDYDYQELNKSLSIKIVDKPFLIPSSMIFSNIEKAFNK